MANVFVDDAIMQGWADTVREKTGTTDNMKPDVLLQKTQDEWGGGGEDYIEYVASCKFDNLNLFNKSEVELNLSNAYDLVSICQQKVLNKTVEHIIVNCPNQVTNIASMFYAQIATKDFETTLKHITINVDTTKATYTTTMFYLLRGLEVIDGIPIDLTSSSGINTAFGHCSALIEIRFKECSIYKNISFSDSSLLSNVSTQSIIDGLADLTGGTAQTITLHKDVKAKLTEEQIATITSKNWTLA